MAWKKAVLAVLLLNSVANAQAHQDNFRRARAHAQHGRQVNAAAAASSSSQSAAPAPPAAAASSSTSSGPAPPAPPPAASTPATAYANPPAGSTTVPTGMPPAPAVPSVAITISVPGAVSGVSGVSTSLPADATLTATNPLIPPLSQLTSGAPGQPTPAYTFSLPANCQSVSGGPPVPTTSIIKTNYPAPTALAPIDSPEVQGWMGELAGIQIPDIPITTNEATCVGNPTAAADPTRCWWTCGGCTRDTDIVTCPNKGDWGVTFDDGPSPYTPLIMNYLQQHNLHATFFCVGSSMYWEPSMVVQEYCSGHQVAPHTWFHPPLTTMTNMQIVAELGWSRKMIQDLLGVTPKYFRAPYGDIDDRVRAIALAMNLKPVQWTRDPQTLAQFDTNDWKIPGGIVTGEQAYQQFQTILQNASTLSTGFIVLEHDLYQQTVDLAAGYTLDLAQSFHPPYQLKSVIECQHLDIKEAYVETASNNTRTTLATAWTGAFLLGGIDTTGTSTSGAAPASESNAIAAANGNSSIPGATKNGAGRAGIGAGAGATVAAVFVGSFVSVLATFFL